VNSAPESRNAFLVSAGAILTATLASLCCIGPVVLLALGLGGVGFAAAFEPYRYYFLGLTAVLLGVSFFLVYRKPKTECAPGDACEKPASRRGQKIALWIVTAMVAGLAAYPYYVGSGASADDSRAELAAFEGGTIELDVGGMTCEGCAGIIQSELAKVPGVEEADVSYDEGKAFVVVGQDGPSEEELIQVISKAGFPAERADGDEKRTESPAG
jgi:mercuric ion transport protein